MEPEKTLNEKAAIQRAAIAHRARWMALLFEELERDGMPADRIEQIMRRAVRRCGKRDGQAYRDAASDPASVKEIIQTRFANEMGQASFCQKDITATEEAGMVHCCFCPLVDAWQKMALPQDRIELLCDIAMDGDRAILDLLGFSMELPCTLAHGDPTCTMHYSRDTQQY